MPANDFLVFGGGAGANVMSQADWAALAQRLSGFQSGVAQSAQLNKAWRQSSIMTAVLAQLIADRTGQDVIDDGTTATILANLKLAVAGGGRLLNIRRITSNQVNTPTPGTTSCYVIVQGAGGAGGNTSTTSAGQACVCGGGGAGGYGASYLTSGFSGVSMTVGAGAVAGVSLAGASSFGALITANGGGNAGNGPAFTNTNAALALGGVGGACTGGNIVNSKGQDGYVGSFGQTSSFVSGAGAPSQFGGGGAGIPTSTSVGNVAVSYGSGGGGALAGASQGVQAGGNGAAGVIIIYDYA